jgi:hypothetical protein
MSGETFPFSAFSHEPRDCQLVVVDLGYSARRRSCGLFWTGAARPLELAFGDAARHTAQAINGLGKPLLVLEAVLSTYHAPSGNPDIRGEFERGRGWYYGAGVLSFAGALRFLQVLADCLKGQSVYLAEAFLSNKDTPTGHAEDAVLIQNWFWEAHPVELRPDVAPASPLVNGVPSVRVFTV